MSRPGAIVAQWRGAWGTRHELRARLYPTGVVTVELRRWFAWRHVAVGSWAEACSRFRLTDTADGCEWAWSREVWSRLSDALGAELNRLDAAAEAERADLARTAERAGLVRRMLGLAEAATETRAEGP